MKKYGIFLVQKHKKTTIWQWVAGLMIRPSLCVGKWQYYGKGNTPKPRKYGLAFVLD